MYLHQLKSYIGNVKEKLTTDKQTDKQTGEMSRLFDPVHKKKVIPPNLKTGCCYVECKSDISLNTVLSLRINRYVILLQFHGDIMSLYVI